MGVQLRAAGREINAPGFHLGPARHCRGCTYLMGPIIIQPCLHSKYVMKSVQNNEGNKSLGNCKGHEV